LEGKEGSLELSLKRGGILGGEGGLAEAVFEERGRYSEGKEDLLTSS